MLESTTGRRIIAGIFVCALALSSILAQGVKQKTTYRYARLRRAWVLDREHARGVRTGVKLPTRY